MLNFFVTSPTAGSAEGSAWTFQSFTGLKPLEPLPVLKPDAAGGPEGAGTAFAATLGIVGEGGVGFGCAGTG